MAEVRILYIATADGLVQLANPGKSDRWREIGRALDGQNVRAVATSPHDPLLAYAGGSAGIDRTANGGAGWSRVVEPPVTALVFDAAGRIVAATEQGVLLISSDGNAWDELGGVAERIVQLVALPDGSVLTVGAGGDVGELVDDTWRARDVGISGVRGVAARQLAPESLLLAATSSLVTPEGTTEFSGQATGALLNLLGSPPALLLATRDALLRSEDGGATLVPVDGPHDVTALVSPQRAVDQVFAGNATGELWSSADRGRNWTRVASGYANVHNLAFARAL